MVYTIIITYNGIQWIEKCLSSLIRSNFSTEIIVVDNGSTDGTQEYIQENFPQVDFIQSKQNLGFGKANNIGIEKAYHAGADFVFLLNQDAWVEVDTLERLVKVASNHLEYGIVSPIHLNGEGTLLDTGFYNYVTRWEGEVRELYSEIFLKRQKEIYEMSFINAAAWLISKKCLETVGGFAPIFSHYGEDNNYCHRVIYHNLKIGVCPEVNIYHDRESRVSKKDKEQKIKSRQLGLLINYLNINIEFDYLSISVKYIKTIVKDFLMFRFSRANNNLNDFKYLIDCRAGIIECRKTTRILSAYLTSNNINDKYPL